MEQTQSYASDLYLNMQGGENYVGCGITAGAGRVGNVKLAACM
jgi:hypothetical protein